MDQPRKDVVRLLDVSADDIFFLPHRSGEIPIAVKVVMSNTMGWQRGMVRLNLEIDRCPEYAEVVMVTDRRVSMQVRIERWKNEFYFCSHKYKTLIRATPSDLLNTIAMKRKELAKLKADVDDLEHDLQILEKQV